MVMLYIMMNMLKICDPSSFNVHDPTSHNKYETLGIRVAWVELAE